MLNSSCKNPRLTSFNNLCPSISSHSHPAFPNKAIEISEMLALIFMYLDLRSLKNTRLVCRFWLNVAQLRLSKSGIVQLDLLTGPSVNFHEMLKSRNVKLPMPFSLSLRIQGDTQKITTLMNLPALYSTVSVTQFLSYGVPLYLSTQLIQKYNQTLMKLDLHLEMASTTSDYLCTIDTKMTWPNLQYFLVREPKGVAGLSDDRLKDISTTVSCIANRSSLLKSFRLYCTNETLGSLLIKSVNIYGVEELVLKGNPFFCMDDESISIFMASSFRSLKFLRMASVFTLNSTGGRMPFFSETCLLSVICQGSKSLKALDLSGVVNPESIPKFPVCPIVQELTVYKFAEETQNFLKFFPALKKLTCHTPGWYDFRELNLQALLPNIVVLKFCEYFSKGLQDSYIFNLFTIFPAIQTLIINPEFLVRCCMLKFEQPEKLDHVYKTVAQVIVFELDDGFQRISCLDRCEPFRFLIVFTRLEKITLSSFVQVMFLPFDEMPRLKSILFPWAETESEYRNMKIIILFKLAESEKNIYLLNCCRIRQDTHSSVNKYMQMFLEYAINCGCGCNFYSSNNRNCCVCDNLQNASTT